MVRDTGMYLHRGCRMHFTSIERFIMCTGIEIISNQGKPYWGRTQDFEQHFEYAGMKIPAGTKIESTYTLYGRNRHYGNRPGNRRPCPSGDS